MDLGQHGIVHSHLRLEVPYLNSTVAVINAKEKSMDSRTTLTRKSTEKVRGDLFFKNPINAQSLPNLNEIIPLPG